MGGWLYEELAKKAGFDSFRQWVEHELTRRRVEEDEFRVNATRLMWGDEAARQVRREQEAS